MNLLQVLCGDLIGRNNVIVNGIKIPYSFFTFTLISVFIGYSSFNLISRLYIRVLCAGGLGYRVWIDMEVG